MAEPMKDLLEGTEQRLATLNRALPFSDEAEKGVLSCVLQDPEERLSECRIVLPKEAFYHDANRLIYEVLLDMLDKAKPIDPVSLTHVMRERDLLNKAGGAAAVSDLFTFVPIPSHFPFYLKVMREKLWLRRLIAADVLNLEEAFQHGMEASSEDVSELVSRAQERIFAITGEDDASDGGKEYDQVILDVIDSVQNQLENTAVIPADRVPFGFVDIDRRMWGAVRGQLIILAARPSMGKSSLAKDIAGNVSNGRGDYKEWWKEGWPHRAKKRVIYFELEMTNKQSGTRDLVGGAGLDLQAMRYGLPLREAHEKLHRRLRDIKDSNMRKYDRPGLSIQKLRAICRRQKRKRGCDLVVIDYLQLMTSESKRAKENRQLEISEISAGLKEMAKELDCVVLALSQLSRSVEDRKDKKPVLSDLRESGSIEQDADVVMMLMRPEYYFEGHEPKGQAILSLPKGRDIGIGEVELVFEAHYTRFSSLGEEPRCLMSNNEDKREKGYASKPQACKQPPGQAQSAPKSRRGPQVESLDEMFPDD